MPRHLKAELLNDVGAMLGEGPVWDARTGELVSVDILAGEVHVFDFDGSRQRIYHLEGHVGAVLPAEEGGWLLVGVDGFSYLHRDGAVEPLLAVHADRPELRFNDAKCDPWGQALAGTMRYDETAGSGKLYRLHGVPDHQPDEPAFEVRTLIEDVGLSNGLGWNDEGTVMYFIDSLARTVVRYPYSPEADHLVDPQVIATIEPGHGLPDGMCVDAAGNLWVALYGGRAVHCYRPDGYLDTVVDVPVLNVTSVAFGGEAGDRLFITTAGGDGTPRGDGVGGLWAVEPGIEGAPATLWHRPGE